MSVLSLRLPASVHEQLRAMAAKEGVSINQFITLAIAEKMASIDTKNYLQERAKGLSRNNLVIFLDCYSCKSVQNCLG